MELSEVEDEIINYGQRYIKDFDFIKFIEEMTKSFPQTVFTKEDKFLINIIVEFTDNYSEQNTFFSEYKIKKINNATSIIINHYKLSQTSFMDIFCFISDSL